MVKVLKICPTEYLHESRDNRELSVYSELGADITVIAKQTAEPVIHMPWNVCRLSTRPLGGKVPNAVNRLATLFIWANEARKIDADIISGHDMISVYIALLSRLRRTRKNAKVIYDSHEFEIGRNAERSFAHKKIIKIAERIAIRHSDKMIVVSDSIAREVQKTYSLREKPAVVRNIPEKWSVDKKIIKDNRDRLLKSMPGATSLIAYHGIVAPSRGIETVIEIVKRVENIGAIIVGYPSSENYLNELKQTVIRDNLQDRIQFVGAVENRDLWKYIGAVDISMLVLPPVSASYYYSLPNKLFEAIQSETPIIGSDFPEISKVIKDYNIGQVVQWDNHEMIAEAVEKLINDKELYKAVKNNVIKAKEELCWENEKKQLINLYCYLSSK